MCPCFRCRELAHHLATWLFGTYHSSMPIAVYIAACALITLFATALMTDYTGKDISGEYA